jgi:hypothetical protein
MEEDVESGIFLFFVSFRPEISVFFLGKALADGGGRRVGQFNSMLY